MHDRNVAGDVATLLVWAASEKLSLGRGFTLASPLMRQLRASYSTRRDGLLDYADWIVFLARAAGLLVPVSRHLCITPGTHEWLAAAPAERLSLLRRAALLSDSAAEHWAASRLPGWRIAEKLSATRAIAGPADPR